MPDNSLSQLKKWLIMMSVPKADNSLPPESGVKLTQPLRMNLQQIFRRAWTRYVVAIALVAFAATLRIWPLQALESSLAWLTFYPAVMVVAIYGGLSAGLLATGLACLTVTFLWPILVAQPFINDSADWMGMAVFILTGSMISGVAVAMLRANARATNGYLKRLEDVSRHLVAAQEVARRRLSSELHDRTSPNIAAININLSIIVTELQQEHSIDFAERLEDTRALIADTAASIRDICADMRPPLLDYAGLAAALESYAQQFARRTGIAVQFDCVNHEERYTPELESLLFRISQEALTNCAKHAHATSARVTLSNGGHPIALTITDNGVGFDTAQLGKVGPIGLGVLNMQNMAEVAGGLFSIESAPGKGTHIAVEIL